VLVIFLMFSILLLVFQYKPVQTWAAKKATAYLSKKLHTKVGISGLYLKPFTSVVLDSLYVLDKQKDTLVSMPKLTVGINGFTLFNSLTARYIDFSQIEMDNANVYLKKYKDSTSNLKFIIDYFSAPGTPSNGQPGKPWQIQFDKITVNNMHFRYKNYLADTVMKQINFDDVDVSGFSAVLTNMDIKNHLFKGGIHNLTLHENKSGFYLKNLSANATVDTNQILMRNLLILTPQSRIQNYLHMKFKSFDDFNDVVNKVYFDGDFKSAQVSSKDIGYFADMGKTRFDLGVDGRIKGLVNNLDSKNLLVTGGQATYVRGNFHLRGLPDWQNTLMELDFQQIATNKRDLDYLISNFSGDPKSVAPDIISKFGNINFSGRFTGLQNDFVAYGTFKTKLGRFDSDVNLKLDKNNVPSYSGKVSANNFNLGELISVSDMGRTTFKADVKGRGDDLKNLNVGANAKLAYVDFRGYHYNNVAVNGTFVKELFSGKVSIKDKNVQLDANGSIDIKPKLPVYNFAANIQNAQLHKLKILDDTITLTTQIKSKVSGNDLKNLSGNILVSPIRIIDPRNNFLVDSINLSINRSDTARYVTLKSDLADASIRGKFDLATLPSYFKSIVKKYIPSLKTTIVPPKPEQFQFNLTLKKLEPVLVMFDPNLKIPDQGTFFGEFNSANKTATLNGYVKTIQYGKTVFHDLIIDENTTDQQLAANISLSKINITDSLFIKNIDISNVLRKDSLNFNIKLADKDATNQLDLYGLVEFGRDTTAKLKLLPSDVIIQRRDWKLQQQVRIRLLNGKTEISNFELSNGQQLVKINGFISDDPADKLKVTFSKFGMDNFDQLTKVADVALKGTLNGDVVLSAITKTPGVDAQLGIDSLTMNNTLVGNVKLQSVIDNGRNEAQVKMSVNNRGEETMNIAGVYSMAKDAGDRALDFNIKMDHAEAIIFGPFIRDLVSDPKGNISSDLKLTGPLSKPQLNGDISFNNTGVTINYLKTAYTINDKIKVTNSVVNLDNLVLRDDHGGEGDVMGTVDLNNLNDPDIEASITAKKLLALNTKFRNNHLYYGTAYATGNFSFNGPVDNMSINIKAKTDAGTVFNIPLNTSSTVGEYDFVKFVSHNDTSKKVPADSNAFHGVTLNMDLSADEKTTVKITTDYGVLEGNGVTNNLKLNITSLGDFEMFGDYLISSGKFEFTAKNFISKNFSVNQGGTIRWTGNPANATINLDAIYEVRTEIANLYDAAGLAPPKGNELVLVQAELILTKSLLLPNIDFDFNFPTDPSIKDDLGTYLNDYNNRSMQALSIIVRRNFAAGTPGNLTNQVASTAGEAVSEFAFNKLNALISQSNIKNFDLNLRSFNDASATVRLLNQRLILNGSLFTNTGSNNIFNNAQTSLLNSNFSDITKDFEAQYLLRKNGDLTARYSYRLLNSTTLNDINQLSLQYVNGVGLVYQRDFDTFGEFFRNFFGRSKRDNQPQQAPTPPPTPAFNNAGSTKPSGPGGGPANKPDGGDGNGDDED
jgi:hypothetical protein